MADFDPQQSAENEANNAPRHDDARNQSCDASGPQGYSGAGCGCGKYDGESLDTSRDFDTSRADSFVADWSGAEKSLVEQAESFEARKTEMDQGMPQQFWVDLVRSQKPESATESAVPVTVHGESLSETLSGQTEQLWSDLVRSQQQSPAELSEPLAGSHSKPAGMGWAADEASEWAPPQREYEPAGAAAEAVEAEGTPATRRDDVEWATPASAQDDWETVRTEALTAEGKPQSLMDAAVEAAQALPEPKQKKTRAARKPAAKKPAKAKKTVAKKPAKKAAKKTVAKKVVKRTPAPKIVKDPTRRAA